jgi:type II secretion system protein N
LGRRLAVACAALALTAFFVVLRLPWERHAAALAQRLAAPHGAQLRLGEVGPALGPEGPVLRARALVLALRDGRRLRADELRVRPALSASWLSGDPSLRLVLSGPEGGADGVLRLGARPGFRGSLSHLDLARLGVDRLAEGVELAGRADLELDLAAEAGGLGGELSLEARDGHVAFPPYGVPMPFATAHGRFALDPEAGLEVREFELDDPTLLLRAEGRVGPGPLARAPLDLRGRLEVRNPGLRAVLADAVALAPDGSAELRLRGTLAEPLLHD